MYAAEFSKFEKNIRKMTNRREHRCRSYSISSEVAGNKGTLSFLAVNTVTAGSSTNPWGMYIPPDGGNLYCALGATAKVAQYSRNLLTGQCTVMSPSTVNVQGAPRSLAGSSDGKSVYCVNAGYDSCSMFSRAYLSDGALTALGTPNIATGVYPNQIAISPDDKFVYITCKNPGGAGSISVFGRNLTTFALSPAGTPSIACGSQPMGIVFTPNGLFAYVANGDGNTISQYSVNTTTGLLTPLGTATIATGSFPSILSISPDGLNLYVCNDASATVGQYSITAGTGQLVALSPATVSGGNGPWSIAITPDGLSAYIAASDGQYIVQYTRDPATGLLTAKSPSTVNVDPFNPPVTGSGGPQAVIVSPDGKNAYSSGTPTASVISQFHIHT